MTGGSILDFQYFHDPDCPKWDTENDQETCQFCGYKPWQTIADYQGEKTL